MAVVNVTSWQDIENNAHSSDSTQTLNLLNDIDLNDEYPLGITSVEIYLNIGYYLNSGTWTLNGDNGQGGRYIIKNLRTSIESPQSIFTNYYGMTSNPNAKIVFKNIDFVNLVLSGADFFNNFSNGSSEFTGSIEFINCRFVGMRMGAAYLFNKKTKIKCTSCYFNMPWYGAGSSNYDYISLIPQNTDTLDASTLPLAYYCWFHESYGGWTLTSAFDAEASVRPPYKTPTTQCSYFGLDGCYIDGEMKVPVNMAWSSYNDDYSYISLYVTSTAVASVYVASTPNVIDIHWIAYNNWSSINRTHHAHCQVINQNGLFNKNFTHTGNNSPRDTTYTRNSAGSQPNIILATPEEMQDVTWLQNQGFPIIDPTT